jgi:hypothetical protein
MKMPAFLTKVGTTISDASPDICVYGGTALMIAGGVWGCINAAKYVPDIMDEYYDDLEDIQNTVCDEDYTEKDKKKDLRDIKFRLAGQMAKTFAGPGLTIVSGATMNIAGFREEKTRYLEASAFAEAAAKAMDKILNNVEKKYGEEGRRYALYGEEPVEIEDKETGEKKTIYRGSESDYRFNLGPYSMILDRGHLYENAGGDAVMLLSAVHDYEDVLNVQYNAGVPIYYYDVLRYLYGAKVIEKLEEKGLLHKDIRRLGWYLRDPKNREELEGDKNRPINLRADTYIGMRPEDEDAYENDMGGVKDKVWVRINPNIPGIVDLVNSTRKIRVGGKYLGVI